VGGIPFNAVKAGRIAVTLAHRQGAATYGVATPLAHIDGQGKRHMHMTRGNQVHARLAKNTRGAVTAFDLAGHRGIDHLYQRMMAGQYA